MSEESQDNLFDGIDFSMLNEEEPAKQTVDKIVQPDPEDVPDDDTKDDSEEIDETTPSDESDETENSSSSSYQVLAKALSEEGVFSLSEDELKDMTDADKIIGAVQKEINSRVEDYKNSLPSEVKDLLDGYDDGVDLNDLLRIKKDKLVFSKIKEEDLEDNEDLKRQVLRKDLELRGMSPEDIEEEIEDIFSLGKEDAKSIKALKNIIRKTDEEVVRLRTEAKESER
jgi:hypothetical protein